MQSDLNSFYGDVVLDSFNMAYMYEEIKIYQIYKEQIFWKKLYLRLIAENAYMKKIQQKQHQKLSFSATVELVCIFV